MKANNITQELSEVFSNDNIIDVYFTPCDRFLVERFSSKGSIIDVLQGCQYGSALLETKIYMALDGVLTSLLTKMEPPLLIPKICNTNSPN